MKVEMEGEQTLCNNHHLIYVEGGHKETHGLR